MKKMTLVEKATMERLHQKKQSMEMFHPEEATMLQLQSYIEQILKSSKLSDEEKIRLLTEAKEKLRRIKDSINPMVVAQTESGEVYFVRKPQPPPSRQRKPSPATRPPSHASSKRSSGPKDSSKRSSRISSRQPSFHDDWIQATADTEDDEAQATADTEDREAQAAADLQEREVQAIADMEDFGNQASPEVGHIGVQWKPDVSHIGTHVRPHAQVKETQSDAEAEIVPLAPPLPKAAIEIVSEEKPLGRLLDSMEKDLQIVPRQYARKFHEFRIFLKNNPHLLRLNALGEAVIEGKTIANSSAADLIRTLFINNEKQNTTGENRLAIALLKNEFQPEMISNSRFLNILSAPNFSPHTSPPSTPNTKSSSVSIAIKPKQAGKGFPKRKRGGKPLPHPPGKRPRILYLYR